MTVREFMLKKYPTNEWMDCPVPKHHWETIQEYADKYHEAKVKNLSSKPMLADRLPNAEDVKRWYQLLVGKSEIEMQKDIEATLR